MNLTPEERERLTKLCAEVGADDTDLVEIMKLHEATDALPLALADLAALEQRIAELENLNRVLCEQKPDGLQYQDVLKQLNERQEQLATVTRERDKYINDWTAVTRERDELQRKYEDECGTSGELKAERDELQRRTDAAMAIEVGESSHEDETVYCVVQGANAMRSRFRQTLALDVSNARKEDA